MDANCATSVGKTRLTTPLEANWNVPLATLTDRLGQNPASIYFYIVNSIDWDGRQFEQRGSAPNGDGGYLTLCTCKHYMRTFRTTVDWPNTWIAGFTRKSAVDDRNFLIYLMQVGWAFSSQRSLWQSDAIPVKTKLAKAAHGNPHGDLFEPSSLEGSEFDPTRYRPPIAEHSHASAVDWHKDVGYQKKGKRPALLVGTPDLTFVWSRPSISYAYQLSRGQKLLLLPEFLKNLREWPQPEVDIRKRSQTSVSCSSKNSAGERRRCGSG